jgi:5-methylcytosine-specific restriction endonuclease McrA
MMFPDAAGQLCDAAYGCRPSLADAANLASSPVPSASARRESNYYGSYISSAAWQTSPARVAELRAAGHRCRLCFASDEEARLEVHHRTYRNFGCELAEDLTTLCHDCHLHVTSMERARKYARSPVLPPSHVPVAPSPPLFDYRTALEIA